MSKVRSAAQHTFTQVTALHCTALQAERFGAAAFRDAPSGAVICGERQRQRIARLEKGVMRSRISVSNFR